MTSHSLTKSIVRWATLASLTVVGLGWTIGTAAAQVSMLRDELRAEATPAPVAPPPKAPAARTAAR